MSIHWFPGHMHKASKEIKKILPKVDLVIEILDARIPYSSDNPLLTSLRDNKPCIKVLNKCDLADADITLEWQTYLEKEQFVKTLAINSNQTEKINKITSLCHKMVPGREDGINKPIHAMIMGIPNVGKSTLINILAGRTIAKTGNEPAVTKDQQRIKLDNNITLSDTPGMLWPKFDHPNIGYRLATTGAIRDTAIDHEDVAFFAAQYLLQHYPENLIKRFELNQLPDTELELLETIGRQRGCLRAGGHVLLDKVCKIFLTEIRDGSLGTLSFETPESIQKELLEVESMKKKKEDKKAARKKAWKKNRK